MGHVDARLEAIGAELPPPPVPVGSYVPVVIAGSFAYVAGQIPLVDGELMNPGIVGDSVSVEDANLCARRCALQALAALKAELGDLDRIRQIVKLEVFVACGPEMTEHPKVANGASDLLAEVLEEAGVHARVAVGVPSLPLGACVEVVVLAQID